ncbi:GGDEF domain-containing protein [Virgisporangium aurantiacum]|uniref:GGDEF domain-containing protein n=1 Tax=Virgisporangium aurantiacum TaxID=175570 RepID=A0A8J4DVQ1_9ACTN|nr:GGDEF domain-containing protein [Virgisporangium aurantiacum]GIJ52645.1 hypothetical protein Vau01_001610 [Virgisporangium aurantiacum]
MVTSTEPAGRRPLAWFLWWQGLLIVVMVALAAAGHDLAATVVAAATGLSAAGAVVVGVRWFRPARPAAWLLLAGAQVGFVAGIVIFMIDDRLLPGQSFPGPADATYLVGQYPLIIAALVLFVRARSPGWQRAALIDAAVLATSAALAAWVYLLRPATAEFGTGATGGLIIVVTYPVMDLIVLAVALRFTLGGGERVPARSLLLGSFAVSLATDTLYLLERIAGTFTPESPTSAGYIVAGVLLGAAALHPSMTGLAERVDAPPLEPTPARLGLLAAGALIAPVILVVEHLRGTLRDVLVIAAACAVLFLLVFVRMSGLVAAHRRHAITDPLTGLYTRRFFGPTLAVEVTRSGRSGVPLGLLLLDVDHFKRINDGFGHPAGDAVLRVVAARLTGRCRSGDIVARYGGEEFAVLVPGAGPDRIAEIAEGLRRAMTEPMPIGDGQEVAVTVSIGTATVPADAGSPEDVVRLADMALYAAKEGGRNRVMAVPAHAVRAGNGAGSTSMSAMLSV